MNYQRGLHRFSQFTALSTFLLIVAGGLVTSTGSGLSVPDWPNTYGHFMFAYPLEGMVGGIFYEHSHRMIASFVGFLTVILTIWVWRRETRRWVKKLALIALISVIVQGALGGITVIYLLPTAVSVAHATLAQTFFVIVSSIALVTSRWWIERPPADTGASATGKSSLTTLAVATSLMVWIQLLLGAVMRHTASGLAVPDFPLAYGSLFPTMTPDAVQGYTETLMRSDIRIAADGPITAGQIMIHLLHRYWGVITGIALGWTAIRAFRLSGHASRLRTLGLMIGLATLLQITLGALIVLMRKPVDVTTTHVALGAFLLVISVMTALHAYRLFGAGSRIPAGSQGAHPPPMMKGAAI